MSLSILAENHPNWKGGVSQGYYQRIVDYNKPCEICNTLEKKRICHHINKNRKDNNYLNHFILCLSCHRKIHWGDKWGRKYSQCIQCNSKKNKYKGKGLCLKCWENKYFKDNKKEIKEKQKEYYIKNKEEILEKQKKYYKNNYIKNKEKILERGRKYRFKNREIVREKDRIRKKAKYNECLIWINKGWRKYNG